MKTCQWTKFLFAGISLLVLSINIHAAARQDIACALEKARTDLRISMATEERIASELAELRKSGEASPDAIETYEYYLSRVRAMVAENRRTVAEMEELSARQEVRRAHAVSAGGDPTADMVDPAIPEEQVIDEVAELDRQLEGSLAEFDGVLLRELDLILAKSSQKMTDLAEEAAAAAQRLRDAGIDIDGDSEEESGESGQGSPAGREQAESEQESGESGEGSPGGGEQAGSEQESGESGEGSPGGGEQAGSEQESGESGEGSPGGREQAGSERDSSETGEARGAAGSGDDREFTSRGKSREGVEGERGHPRNRYDPRNDDIVARQLREAAEEETDPELRKKLWKEYEQYKENTGR